MSWKLTIRLGFLGVPQLHLQGDQDLLRDREQGVGYQNLIPSPLNPVELSGGQYHLRPMGACLQPSHTDRDTRVEVVLAQRENRVDRAQIVRS